METKQETLICFDCGFFAKFEYFEITEEGQMICPNCSSDSPNNVE